MLSLRTYWETFGGPTGIASHDEEICPGLFTSTAFILESACRCMAGYEEAVTALTHRVLHFRGQSYLTLQRDGFELIDEQRGQGQPLDTS